jgi:methionine-rich copper-binding protein CopC
MHSDARRRTRTIGFCVSTILIVLSAPAFGHAALTSSDPEKGARLSAAPESVTINYAEPPTNNSRFAVTDGCEREITDSIEILNDTIEATLRDGQPGKWTAEWTVVSAVDGHATEDSVSFQVRGEPDCSQAADDEGPAVRTGPESSFPIVPIAIATGLILALAIGLRLRSRPDQP